MNEPKPTTPESIPAETALEELVNSNVYLFGHGTPSQDSAQAAIAGGLLTRHTDLMSTAYGLETVAENPDAADHDMALLRDWPHHRMPYVVLLGVQRLEGDQIPHRRYLQSIVQPRPPEDEYDKDYGRPYVIDKKFVAGYFDAHTGAFTPNDTYDPTYDNSLLTTTVNEDIQNEKNPVNALAAMGMAGVVLPEEVQPDQQSDDDVEDVW
jgi:hypothetical protein